MPKQTLYVTSKAFQNNGHIPVRYTGYGADESPPLTLSGIVPEAKSIAVVMADLDIPLMREFSHWLIWNLPVQTDIPGAIPRGKMPGGGLGGARQGVAYGRHEYKGPKPPKFIRTQHRYVFTVSILDTVLEIGSDASRKKLLAAMQNHILQQGSITGIYQNGK